MNINEFAEKMKITLADILQKEIRSISTLKPNGIRLCGMVVTEPDSNIGCTIYLEPFFESFLDTGDWERTVSDVLSFYDDNRVSGSFDLEWFYDFSQVRKNLIYRLINYKENQKLLSSVPHTRFLDLAKIYYVDCQIGKTAGSILIHHNHMEKWGITENELIATAEENTPRLYPANLHPICDILGLDDDIGPILEMPVPMFVLSNTENHNGAAAVCYKDVLERFSQKIQDDLVILPSSVHETLLLPLQKSKSIESLREMVYDTNRTMLNRSEYLSDNVYLYSMKDRRFIIA